MYAACDWLEEHDAPALARICRGWVDRGRRPAAGDLDDFWWLLQDVPGTRLIMGGADAVRMPDPFAVRTTWLSQGGFSAWARWYYRYPLFAMARVGVEGVAPARGFNRRGHQTYRFTITRHAIPPSPGECRPYLKADFWAAYKGAKPGLHSITVVRDTRAEWDELLNDVFLAYARSEPE